MSRSLVILFFSLFCGQISLLPLAAQADRPYNHPNKSTQISQLPTSNQVLAQTKSEPTEPGLTESNVYNILNGMREANQQKNAAGVTQSMANFIVSRNRFIMPKQTLDTTVYGKSQHLADLEGEFSGTTSYKYHGYQAKVNVCPDRSFAIAQENYFLEVKLQTGERALFAIATSSKLAIINGEAKIFSVSSTVEMENPNAFLVRASAY